MCPEDGGGSCGLQDTLRGRDQVGGCWLFSREPKESHAAAGKVYLMLFVSHEFAPQELQRR